MELCQPVSPVRPVQGGAVGAGAVHECQVLAGLTPQARTFRPRACAIATRSAVSRSARGQICGSPAPITRSISASSKRGVRKPTDQRQQRLVHAQGGVPVERAKAEAAAARSTGARAIRASNASGGGRRLHFQADREARRRLPAGNAQSSKPSSGTIARRRSVRPASFRHPVPASCAQVRSATAPWPSLVRSTRSSWTSTSTPSALASGYRSRCPAAPIVRASSNAANVFSGA